MNETIETIVKALEITSKEIKRVMTDELNEFGEMEKFKRIDHLSRAISMQMIALRGIIIYELAGGIK